MPDGPIGTKSITYIPDAPNGYHMDVRSRKTTLCINFI